MPVITPTPYAGTEEEGWSGESPPWEFKPQMVSTPDFGKLTSHIPSWVSATHQQKSGLYFGQTGYIAYAPEISMQERNWRTKWEYGAGGKHKAYGWFSDDGHGPGMHKYYEARKWEPTSDWMKDEYGRGQFTTTEQWETKFRGHGTHYDGGTQGATEILDWYAYDSDPEYQGWLKEVDKARFMSLDDIRAAEEWIMHGGTEGSDRRELEALRAELEELRGIIESGGIGGGRPGAGTPGLVPGIEGPGYGGQQQLGNPYLPPISDVHTGGLTPDQWIQQQADWNAKSAEERQQWAASLEDQRKTWELEALDRLRDERDTWNTEQQAALASQLAVYGQDSAAERAAWQEGRAADAAYYDAQLNQYNLDRQDWQRTIEDLNQQYIQAQEHWKQRQEVERRDIEASLGQRYQTQWADQVRQIEQGYADLLSQAHTEAEAQQLIQARDSELRLLDQQAGFNREEQQWARRDQIYQDQMRGLYGDIGMRRDEYDRFQNEWDAQYPQNEWRRPPIGQPGIQPQPGYGGYGTPYNPYDIPTVLDPRPGRGTPPPPSQRPPQFSEPTANQQPTVTVPLPFGGGTIDIPLNYDAIVNNPLLSDEVKEALLGQAQEFAGERDSIVEPGSFADMAAGGQDIQIPSNAWTDLTIPQETTGPGISSLGGPSTGGPTPKTVPTGPKGEPIDFPKTYQEAVEQGIYNDPYEFSEDRYTGKDIELSRQQMYESWIESHYSPGDEVSIMPLGNDSDTSFIVPPNAVPLGAYQDTPTAYPDNWKDAEREGIWNPSMEGIAYTGGDDYQANVQANYEDWKGRQVTDYPDTVAEAQLYDIWQPQGEYAGHRKDHPDHFEKVQLKEYEDWKASQVTDYPDTWQDAEKEGIWNPSMEGEKYNSGKGRDFQELAQAQYEDWKERHPIEPEVSAPRGHWSGFDADGNMTGGYFDMDDFWEKLFGPPQGTQQGIHPDFTPPPGGFSTSAIDPWYNERTGEEWFAGTGGYTPREGSGWVRGHLPEDWTAPAGEEHDKWLDTYQLSYDDEGKPVYNKPRTEGIPPVGGPAPWQAPEGYADTWQDAMRGGWKPEAGHGGDPDAVRRQYEEWATKDAEIRPQRPGQWDQILKDWEDARVEEERAKQFEGFNPPDPDMAYPEVMQDWWNPQTGQSRQLTTGYTPEEGSGWVEKESQWLSTDSDERQLWGDNYGQWLHDRRLDEIISEFGPNSVERRTATEEALQNFETQQQTWADFTQQQEQQQALDQQRLQSERQTLRSDWEDQLAEYNQFKDIEWEKDDRWQRDQAEQARQGQYDWNRQARNNTAAWEAGTARDQANYERDADLIRIPEWSTWDLQSSQYPQSPTSTWNTRRDNLYDLRHQQNQRLWQAQQTQRESQWQRQFDTERSQQQSAWDTQMSQAQRSWEDQMSQAQNTWNTQYDIQQGHISDLTGQIGGLETTLAEQNAANRAWREAATRNQEMLIKDAERARTAAAYGSQGSQLNPKVRGVRTYMRPRSARPWIGRGTTGAFNRGGMRIKSLNI